ncbi:MAG: beta-glucosidase-related glycosidase, partial [Lachnospiraceae bacterium]|nr:beta-glucosidase-related glycosidase [Lachnospiraceae bacterium]
YEYGKICGNYSIWANTTILWGAGTNLHRVPYNARNHEYYSEDPILTAFQGAAFVKGGNEYGCIIAEKHFAFNDTEINRTGISVFMTEQKAREGELRAMQSAIEDAGELGIMTAYNRVGVTADNAHYGLMMNILRGEWGFKGLMSEDFIQDPFYTSLKDAVHCGITMTCNTGDNKMEAVSSKWSYWTEENVSKDATLMNDLKTVMRYQNYALANSNAMDGLGISSKIVSVNTWYDNALIAVKIFFALLMILFAYFYMKSGKKSNIIVEEIRKEEVLI